MKISMKLNFNMLRPYLVDFYVVSLFDPKCPTKFQLDKNVLANGIIVNNFYEV